jgi:hypothetical protein
VYVDAPRKPVGPPIPTTKATNTKAAVDISSAPPVSANRSNGPFSPRTATASPKTAAAPKASPTTIRLAFPQQQQQPPPQPTHIAPSPRRQPHSTQQLKASPESNLALPNQVQADLDSWGPVDHAVNRLTRLDHFYSKLFSTFSSSASCGANSNGTNSEERDSLLRQLSECLKDDLERCRAELNVMENGHSNHDESMLADAFKDLDSVSGVREMELFAKKYDLTLIPDE